jgi:hypothetical protein
MQLIFYANWAQGQVDQTQVDPANPAPPDQVIRNWAAMWNITLSALYNPAAGVTAAYEHASLVVARWEFLGALYRGTSGNTDVADARAYADRFLAAAYGPLHNLSGTCAPGGSEFFSVFRNKSLHGFTPASVYRRRDGEAFGWP